MSGDQPLPGTPSDQVPAILATGRSDISTLFISMAERHPEGADADYLRWHTLDHRPEQQRLQRIRSSLRVVSTPACRAARAASDSDYDAVDHVMTYFFTDQQGLKDFGDLSVALRDAGRSPFILKPVQRGVYTVEGRHSALAVTVGADVLPWLPVKGVYLLLEEGDVKAEDATDQLLNVPGVAGVWTATSEPTEFSTADAGQRIHFCFLTGDPVEVAGQLQPLLAQRWQSGAIRARLAAPFYALVPFEWGRYLP